ncbi:hypothetical protein BD779DRAFT_1494154 [Infundibulicybe gibba]|nr:hypothetical protein BD779DRAFT_1593311 [Infundibulicybe gibba]KAF8896137.1 hypothetical protein BD779DRAFT_1494154 [Infundibulicybe gibba]
MTAAVRSIVFRNISNSSSTNTSTVNMLEATRHSEVGEGAMKCMCKVLPSYKRGWIWKVSNWGPILVCRTIHTFLWADDHPSHHFPTGSGLIIPSLCGPGTDKILEGPSDGGVGGVGQTGVTMWRRRGLFFKRSLNGLAKIFLFENCVHIGLTMI